MTKKNEFAFLNKFLDQHKITPIFVDIGASGSPPEIWTNVAETAVYIGFDPDRREIHESRSGGFKKNIIINKAITPDPRTQEVRFYLTKSPYCSSTLHPDTESLHNYHYADLFVVEDQVSAPACTLEAALDEIEVTQIDWVKTDSQGIDLQIYNSLSPDVRKNLLAIDIEPGLLDAYQEEDLFPEAHTALKKDGFWLADITVKGPVRVNQKTLEKLWELDPQYTFQFIAQHTKKCPGWVEARYLRSIESLRKEGAPRRSYLLLWGISFLDGQYGFCLDLSLAYQEAFGDDDNSSSMWELAFAKFPVPSEVEYQQLPFHRKVKRKLYKLYKKVF